MKTLSDTFTFTVPKTHPEGGTKIQKSFTFQKCDNDAEAQTVIDEKKLTLVELVDNILKANARSNAYQNALSAYLPSKVSKEDIIERMVRDYIRCGVSEDAARKQVESLLAASV